MPFEIENGKTIVRFGYGDVLISLGRNPQKPFENEILLTADDRENPVNILMDVERWKREFKGKSTNETNTPVRLAFDSVAGLDALLITLTELRAIMEAGGSKEMFCLECNCPHTLPVNVNRADAKCISCGAVGDMKEPVSGIFPDPQNSVWSK